MSIVQTQTTSFKKELYTAVHNLSTDVVNEVSGTGYTAGGQAMTGVSISSSGSTAYVNWDNVSWTAALTARCALIYNVTQGNKSIAVLDFGSDKTSTTTFTITMPANTSTTALIRSSN